MEEIQGKKKKRLPAGPVLFKYSINFLLNNSFQFFGLRRTIHPHLYFYLVGFYFDIGLTNLNFLLLFLRRTIRLVQKTLMEGLQVLIVDESYFRRSIIHYFDSDKFYYIFKHWTKGVLSNMIERRKQLSKRERFTYVESYPALTCIIQAREESYRSIVNELFRVKLPILKIVSGLDDLSYLSWFSFSNPISVETRSFYLRLLKQISLRVNRLNRKYYSYYFQKKLNEKIKTSRNKKT